jgi:DNA-binding IclR family transcriptional regulator
MPQYNNSVENAAKILSLFTSANPSWRKFEVARELGISKTTTFNLLVTLEKTGLLKKNPENQQYELGQKIASLGAVMAAKNELNQKAAGFIQELSSAYGVSARLGIWDGDAVLIIFTGQPINAPHQPSYQAGPRIVAYSTAVGRAILAHMEKNRVKDYLNRANIVKYTSKTKVKKSQILKELEDTKQRGYAICDEEMLYGAAAIAAPIFDKHNDIAGALTILGTKDEILGSNMNRLIQGLSSKTIQISQSLGFGVS